MWYVFKKMAQLFSPSGVFVSNGEVFIADAYNDRVRKVLRNGEIVTIAGTGEWGYNGDDQLATDAKLEWPHSVVVSSSNQVYISEVAGQRIRKIDRNGIISTIAGNGYNGDGQLAINAQLNCPSGLFVTEDEEVLLADDGNNRVRKIDRNGIITTIAGNGKGNLMEMENWQPMLHCMAHQVFSNTNMKFTFQIAITGGLEKLIKMESYQQV